jgi:hypothetical protein
MRILFLFLFFINLVTSPMFGQVETQTSFNFVELPASSRVSAMGGELNNIKDSDLSLAYGNPALLNEQMDNQAILSFSSYLAGSSYGFFSYGKDVKDIGTFSVNLLFLDYGSFRETDNSGQVIGEFKAKETGFSLAGSRMIGERLSAGVQMKFLFSNLEQYSAFGMGADLGLTYHIDEEFLTASFVMKNMGYQLSSYYADAKKTPLPFNMQLGVSKKMKHAPFRLSLVLDNLQKWDLTYTDPNLIGKKDPLTGDPIEIKPSSFGDKLMRHVIFGGEILIGDVIQIQLAYNYRRRKELKVANSPGMAGMSFGVGAKIKSFNLNYSFANYTRAANSHQFTLALRFNDMKKEKTLN